MKKLLSAFMAAVVTAACASGCSSKKRADVGSDTEPTTAPVSTLQPDPLDPANTTAAATTAARATTSAVTTKAEVTQAASDHQPDPLGGGSFEYNEDGAVVFEKEPEEVDDRTLISAAQALFESACRTQWNYTVGCPFSIDTKDYVENQFGWKFFKVTDSRIKSVKDVESLYFKVFSDRYPHSEIAELYTEKNGAVYALSGNRGADIYYSSSRITGIESKSADEIFFTVENYYDGSDFGQEAYAETETFSAVIEGGSVWKAGQFRLPY